MNVYPWANVLKAADDAAQAGMTVYQQFNCEHCGAKQTMEQPFSFHKEGICEECKLITNIEKNGHNFMAVAGV